MSLNMNNTYLFMNWVLERSGNSACGRGWEGGFAPSDNSQSNDFQAFVLYMRNSLTPQLWEDFMKSDSALSLTQSFVDSVKQKVVPKPKKPRATKKTQVTLDLPVEESNTPLMEEGVVAAAKPKKPRATKKVQATLDLPVEESKTAVPE